MLPTMLYRWTLGGTGAGVLLSSVAAIVETLLRGVGTFLVAVWRVISMAMGWSDGFTEDEPSRGVVASATRAALKVAESLVPAEGLSMMNDEIL